MSMSHLPEGIAAPIGDLALSLGIPSDQLRFTLCLFLSVPLGYLHRLLPGATVKHVYR